MENASKALLIAAGMLLVVMLLSLLIVFWNDISAYFSAQHDATMLEQLVEFNNKFQNYAGKTIRGNELVSIMNRIVDYNNYQADMEGYEPIKICIDFQGHYKELRYYEDDDHPYGVSDDLITSNMVKNYTNATDTNVNDTTIKTIATTSSRLVSFYDIDGLTDTKLQQLAARISDIVDDWQDEGRDEYIEEYKKYRQQILTKILGSANVVSMDDESAYEDWIDKIKTATQQYYQYTMFKRAVFDCTNVSYNETNGRVDRMDFKVVLEYDEASSSDKIKFD